MTAAEIITVLEIELQKAQSDFYPDRRIALQTAIRMLQETIRSDEDVHRG